MNRYGYYQRDLVWVLVVIAIIVLGIVGTLWAYDGDPKCLIAECRRFKD